MNDLKSKIESILFVFADPISVKKISKTLKVKEKDILLSIKDLKKDYKNRGINILEKDGKLQMVSAPENAYLMDGLVQSSLSEKLTPAALETLAVIAYKEPISREEIDQIRGVNSVFSLKALLMRGLIDRIPSGDKDKKNDLFKTSLDFLKKIGISGVNELPKYDELSRISGDTEDNKK